MGPSAVTVTGPGNTGERSRARGRWRREADLFEKVTAARRKVPGRGGIIIIGFLSLRLCHPNELLSLFFKINISCGRAAVLRVKVGRAKLPLTSEQLLWNSVVLAKSQGGIL